MATELYLRSVQFGLGAFIYVCMMGVLGVDIRTGVHGLFASIVLYGMYAAATILRMAAGFNSCVDAKKQLTEEITEAQKFFSSRAGFTSK